MINSTAAQPQCPTKPGKVEAKAETSTALPPRPYTEYTIFFRMERSRILQSTGIIDQEILTSLDPFHVDPVESPRPAGYEGLTLPPYWYSSSHKSVVEKKRKHRKRAGRMDLKTLSKTISASWRQADPQVVEYCRRLARVELARYNEKTKGMNLTKLKITKKNKAGTKVPDSTISQGRQQPDESIKMQQAATKDVSNGALPLPVFSTLQAKHNQVVNNMTTSISMPTSQPNEHHQHQHQQNQAAAATSSMLMCTYGVTHTVTDVANSPKHCSSNDIDGPRIDREDEAFLQMLRLQDAQRQLKAAAQQEMSSRTPGPDTCSSAFSSMNNKPEFTLRVSAPDGIPSQALQQLMNVNAERQIATTTMGNGNQNVQIFLGRNDASALKLNSSMICVPSHVPSQSEDIRPVERRAPRRASMPANANQDLSLSFRKELDAGHFTCVPNWEKECADTLLDILDVPQEDNVTPILVDTNCEPQITLSEDLRSFMKDIGM